MSKVPMYLSKEGSIGTIYFNRPEKRNAMNLESWEMIPELLDEAEADPSIKVLVLRGVNDVAFSAGADISEFKDIRSDAEKSKKYDETSSKAGKRLSGFKKPTVAMIQGFCVGGGAGLALYCDFRISDTTGKFGITPSKLGLVYGVPATKRAVDLLGPSRAKDILMSGRIIESDEALRIGFIDKLYEPDQVVEKTYEYAELLASRAQFTVRATKKIVAEILEGASENSTEVQQLVEDAYDSEDYKEGIKAFMEKRKPDFKYS